MLFPVTSKEVIPDGAWNCDNRPVEGAEKKALDRVPIFVNTKTAAIRVLEAEKNKNAQRQPAKISRQICHYAVAEFFMA